jgi:hypothetical protein
MKCALFALVICSLIAVSFATYGVDVSQETLPSAWTCLQQNGYSFAIVRVRLFLAPSPQRGNAKSLRTNKSHEI